MNKSYCIYILEYGKTTTKKLIGKYSSEGEALSALRGLRDFCQGPDIDYVLETVG